jgi:hypothetical protein
MTPLSQQLLDYPAKMAEKLVNLRWEGPVSSEPDPDEVASRAEIRRDFLEGYATGLAVGKFVGALEGARVARLFNLIPTELAIERCEADLAALLEGASK